jgi:magnesium transporter
MLKVFQLNNNRLCETTEDKGDIFVYTCPDDKEKAHLISFWQVDEHTLNSALDPDELGRIEFDPTHLAAIIKKPKRYTMNDNFVFKNSSVGLFLYADKLVVVSGEEGIAWESRLFNKVTSVRDVFLRTIYHCVIHFEEHLKVIRKISEELEGEINQAVTNKDLLHMFKISKGLVYYLDAINSNSKVIERLKMHSPKLAFDQDMSDFLDDLIIESGQCYQQADSYLDVLSSMTDALASIINNNLNIRLKRLTVVSICIMTPTFIVSLFSMNVPLPLPQSGTLFSFWLVMGMASVSVVGLLLLGYYKKL